MGEKITRTDHNKSIRTIDPASIGIGRWIFSICSIWFIDLPIPPCMQTIFFSINAARGSQLNNLFIRCHAHIPSLSPYTWSFISPILHPNNGSFTQFLYLPYAQCTRSENQKGHWYQQPHDCRGLNVLDVDIQPANSLRKNIVKLKINHRQIASEWCSKLWFKNLTKQLGKKSAMFKR